jgi:hypothetical protein
VAQVAVDDAANARRPRHGHQRPPQPRRGRACGGVRPLVRWASAVGIPLPAASAFRTKRAGEHLLRFRGAHGPGRRRSAVALRRPSPPGDEVGRVGAANSMWPVIRARPCRGKLAAAFWSRHAWTRYGHLVAGNLSQVHGAHGWRFLRNVSGALAGFVDVAYPRLSAHEQAGQVSEQDQWSAPARHGDHRHGVRPCTSQSPDHPRIYWFSRGDQRVPSDRGNAVQGNKDPLDSAPLLFSGFQRICRANPYPPSR